MSEILFTPAVRDNLIPLIGLFAKSGGGKTLTSLLLARGIVGPKGRIAVTDTENRRAEHFADDPRVSPYSVFQLQPPYNPDAYLAQHAAAVKQADIWIVDSLTHEWTGSGGCLEMVESYVDQKAGNDWEKRDKFKMPAWARVSPQHEALVAALMRSPIPIICCFRAKDKVVMEKVPQGEQGAGKTKISLDQDAPVARKDLIYEMTIAFALREEHILDSQKKATAEKQGGYFEIVKQGAPSLYRAITAVKADQLGIEHGRAIAQWMKPPASKPVDETKRLRVELWNLCASKRGADPADPAPVEQWLMENDIISDTQTIKTLTAEELPGVIAKVKERL